MLDYLKNKSESEILSKVLIDFLVQTYNELRTNSFRSRASHWKQAGAAEHKFQVFLGSVHWQCESSDRLIANVFESKPDDAAAIKFFALKKFAFCSDMTESYLC